MRTVCPKYFGIVLITLAVLLLSGCGDGQGSDVTIVEHDGEQLVQLMQDVKTAVQNEDEAKFVAMFPSGSNAKRVWKQLMKMKWDDGENYVMQIIQHPGLERASADLRVNKLTLCEWFEIDRGYKTHNEVRSTTWTFARGDSAWRLSGLRLDAAHTSYGDIVRDLNRMDHFQYEALAMDWEEYGDPSPVLTRTLQALGDENIDALKACTVDGTMFFAYEKGIEFPNIASGNTVSGKSNRDDCGEFLSRQIKNMRNASGELKLNAIDLDRYVTAYRVNSMPRNCTKLKLVMEFAEPTVPEHVASLTVSWSASYVMQKWLAEYINVDRIDFKS
jgi:hypothetical protein